MGRAAGGTVLERGERFYVQLTLSKDNRQAFLLATCSTPDQADARAIVVAELVRQLRAHGYDALVEKTAAAAASATDERLKIIKRQVAGTISGEETPQAAEFRGSKKTTFRELGEAWTSGALHRTYPDHVPLKGTATDDGWRLEKHVYPHVEGIAIAHFTLDDAQEVLRKLPDKLSPASRRHIAQLMARVLKLAAYPCRLIARSPIPPGFLPRLRGDKAKVYLYPDEDAKLLAKTEIPLVYRMTYGVLAREGMRSGELRRLTIDDFDLQRGAVKLDENKTDDPRTWALDHGVARALSLYREHFRAEAKGTELMLVEPDIRKHPAPRPVNVDRMANRFRAHLQNAGVTRPELFETNAARRRIRIHDLRATFVTLALANGKTEAWVADRTGHKSSGMINRYRRAARTAVELNLGQLRPLDEAIPELAKLAAQSQPKTQPGSRGGPGRSGRPRKTSRKVATRIARRRTLASLGSGAARRESSSLSSCTGRNVHLASALSCS
jgi:integrase